MQKCIVRLFSRLGKGWSMIDLKELGAIVANIAGAVAIISGIIFASVAYLKQWGVQGKWLTGSAFVLGAVIALFIRYAMLPAQSFRDWVFTVLFGLVAGWFATGAYKGVEGIAQRAVMKATEAATLAAVDCVEDNQ